MKKTKRRSKVEVKGKNISREGSSLYLIYPIAVIVFLVPLIVHMKAVPFNGGNLEIWIGQKGAIDFFAYYKVFWFLALTIISLILFLFDFYNKKRFLKSTNIYIPIGIYSAFTILSTLFAQYKDVTLLGYVDRYENIFVLLSYMLVLFITVNIVNDDKQIKVILGALFLSAVVIGIIGILQYFGHDFFKTEFAKELIIPFKYQNNPPKIKFTIEGNAIYSTLSHYNYVGSYMAMLFPLSLVLFITSKNKRNKILLGLFSLLMFINWVGSKSRAGIVGGVFAIFVLIIVFRKQLIKKWKIVLAGCLGMVLVFAVLNRASMNSLISRLSTLYVDPAMSVDTRQIKDITFKDKTLNIIASQDSLRAEIIGKQIFFNDENGKYLPFEYKDGNIIFNDERYMKYSITLNSVNNLTVMTVQTGGLKAVFNVNDNGFKFLDYKGTPADAQVAEKWGFEGKETLGSSRGYIWSRSIPLLKKTIFLGFGPDTFAMYFPQNDFMGKLIAYGDTQIMVDKPHNLYLQTGINTGVISLLAMLVLFIGYFIQSIKLYIKNDLNDFKSAAGLGIFTAFCGYTAAGLFNDSLISVAPVFWVLLGLGVSINLMIGRHEPMIK